MAALEAVIAVADEDEGREVFYSADQQPQDVKRGLVGPVDILENENSRSRSAGLTRKRRHNLVRHGPPPHDLLKLPTGAFCNDKEGPERTRSKQRVAGSPEDAS